jgi:NAD(P)-dependent dehydrogenase (short-subunit alcohol dehydrogenase family)
LATIWITGASSGIGAALALRLAQDGHEVAASARGAERLARLSDQARQADGRIQAYPLDVTDRGAAAAVLAEIERELGPVDTAVSPPARTTRSALATSRRRISPVWSRSTCSAPPTASSRSCAG